MFKDPLGRAEGEPLDPQRHTITDLQIREKGNPRLFAAVWQQNPRSIGGGIIKTDYFNFISASEVPIKECISVRAWDLAFSEKQVAKAKPDYTVGCRMLLHNNGDNYAFYIYNIVRWQKTWSQTKTEMRDLALMDGIETAIVLEGGGPQKGLGDSIKNETDFLPFTVRVRSPISDKVARAQYWGDKLEIGKIYMVKGDWNKACLNECEVFNKGAFDDQVDAISLAFYDLMLYLKEASFTTVPVRGLYGRRR